ncbi:hypothetical protein QFZ56_003818 [Streptomyces achromogenes]|uniref:Uncharacterized protein n=1 Tax=Streptomyces achromogenes TaxID=67255 RepID=A0ABU0Q4P6_STRAH|nr:hypothetical protein [Streptomyces achromogenes]MDQ0684855.1 hypothetical protein [Streptomyces achromogenes]
MSTAPRFRRTPPVQQYGTADIKHMTSEEIGAALEAGHLHDLSNGNDPDATVDHKRDCTKPNVQRDLRDTRTIRLGDPVTYHCLNCDATKEI